MRILVIEDEKLLADSIRTLLEKKGFGVEVAYDGETGEEYAELGIYDLLILDVMMPKMNGYEVARRVRSQKCGTPILMLTAKSELEDRITGLNAGADYYLTKNFLHDLINATFSSSDRIGVIEEYNLRFYRTNTSVSQILVYADISNELTVLRNLVEQMLELARADNIQHRPLFSSVDFSRLVFDATLPFEPIFYEKGLSLQTEITENITVTGDPSQLRQVLDILLDNAQKYSSTNAATWVTLRRHGKGRCLLSVANEGEEISQDDLRNLFKRFYRADQARTRTGSFGLGLSIAETIISQHNGKIWAESRENINTFYVELYSSSNAPVYN